MGIFDKLFGGKEKPRKQHPDASMEAAMRAHAEPVFREWAKLAEEEKVKKDKPDLEKLKKEKDVEGLINLLRDEDDDIRSEVALNLGEIGDTRAVEPLIQALNDKSLEVRLSAALSLGDIGDRRAIEPLVQAFRDKDAQVRLYTAEVLGKMGAHINLSWKRIRSDILLLNKYKFAYV